MRKGTINVQTENIFPIIKKFLYSEHEIFLRELISNAVDATTKLTKLVSLGKADLELGDLTIKVELDTKKKILKVIDRGIGMTEEEVLKYINEIAFSGAEEFIKKYLQHTDQKDTGIIGHFGLGFYSSFMVAKRVELITKSYLPDQVAVKWSCDGTPEFTIEVADKVDRGTEVIVYFDEEHEDFNDEIRILNILKKYARFLPYPIQFGTEKVTEQVEGVTDKEGKPTYRTVEKPRIINKVEPLWKKPPQQLKSEDYEKFYYELYPYSYDKPVFWIHLNVDYPFTLSGILYFPKLKKFFELNKNKIQLYCNQVFVTDNVENIVPDFLMLLHGVIDSPDIPLNVSRSYLQSDPNLKKINNHITRKVADKLEELFKESREDFEKKWEDIEIFIRYGMMTHEEFYERAEKFALYKDTEGKYHTWDEYKKLIEDKHKDKHKQLVVLYTNNPEEQFSYIEQVKSKGYHVLVLNSVVDVHFIDFLERKLDKVSFKRVDADVSDRLIEKDEKKNIEKLSADEKKTLEEWFKTAITDNHITVRIESLHESEPAVKLVQPEFMRRLHDMSQVSGGLMDPGMERAYTLIINANHPVITDLADTVDEEKRKNKIQHLLDLAMLEQGLLKGEKLTRFIQRNFELLK
ncbi:MAG: molecular chaperone HtpG [Bacteroidales bacterium]|nr:molecular chaperone HtpG [Bacteroidales bacterium]